MKTAIEWLIDKHFGGIENCTPDFRKHIEEAIEMEKQQIINAWINANYKSNALEYFKKEWAEQYYNKTFKK